MPKIKAQFSVKIDAEILEAARSKAKVNEQAFQSLVEEALSRYVFSKDTLETSCDPERLEKIQDMTHRHGGMLKNINEKLMESELYNELIFDRLLFETGIKDQGERKRVLNDARSRTKSEAKKRLYND